MSDVLWTCPVHGFVAAAESPRGTLCTEEDPGRPFGNCARVCKYPLQSRITGEVINSHEVQEAARQAGNPDPDLQAHHQKRKEDPMGKYSPRKAGTATCAECSKDMEGEHTRAQRCTECRQKRPTARRKRPKQKTTTNATPPARAEHAPTQAGQAPGPGPDLKPGLASYNGKIQCFHCIGDDCGPDHECRQMRETIERGENGEAPTFGHAWALADDFAPAGRLDGPQLPLAERVAHLEEQLAKVTQVALDVAEQARRLEERIYGEASA